MLGRIAFLCALLTLVGCNGSGTRVEMPAFSATSATDQAFAVYDGNRDGVLDARELERCPSLKGALERIDTNGDKRISKEELQDYLGSYEDSQVGLMEMIIRVTLDDKPLTGATVDMEPESFMGSGISPATGTTDNSGRARMKLKGADGFGMQFGCYKVRISKKEAGRETLPARYNAESKLGFEAATSIRGNSGTAFKLTSK
jgi:hypothetical protein